MSSSAARFRERRPELLPPHETPGRLFVLYGRLLGPLLGGYLLFDRAFAYLHLPGSPLFVAEMMLGLGAVAALAATRYFLVPARDEPVLALLTAFALWGLIRTVPGVGTYQLDALRDAALWFYCLFAYFVIAALARSPELLDRLITQLTRFVPWLLVWLPFAVVLSPLAPDAPKVPFTTVSVLSHKPGSAAIAALLVLGCMWLLPGRRSPRSRAAWSLLALTVIALAATQNRGGLLGVLAGGVIGLVLMRRHAGLLVRLALVVTLGLGMASLLSLKVPFGGLQGRDFSASQLVANVVSLGGKETPGNLGGTVEGRQELWSRILDKQVTDGRLVGGSGFGQNLATEVGVYDAGKDTLRSPHNSHLHILARMGVVGVSLWAALWLAWYWRMFAGCRRLARDGEHTRRQVAVLSMMVATAVLVSCIFDPQLEGPQVAALLWTSFGIGVAVTTIRSWFRPGSTGRDGAVTASRGGP
ncbi:hypothetical protein E1218_28860 [Kribbella turkmenica]|uniref:O-antigen ligase-related domain-containing protein n=1 Tax=Kribbella turkmenica TaxID=2530375 RepID=A0A4R4WDN6_9ACTN|nr:O-antigen ligase family protein [Kribbella turkmenica]TDD16942.1 hypothetical protein E1218_28860 [Kribbella turkmenica]